VLSGHLQRPNDTLGNGEGSKIDGEIEGAYNSIENLPRQANSRNPSLKDPGPRNAGEIEGDDNGGK
jgi:hypothetical protein